MSLLNVFVAKSSGCIITDTSAYSSGGELLGYQTKAIALPSLRAAIATRGAVVFGWVAAMTLQAARAPTRCIDDLDLKALLERAEDQVLYQMGDAGCTDVEIVIMGWSRKARRVVAFYCDSEEGRGRHFEPCPAPQGLTLSPTITDDPEFAAAARITHAGPSALVSVAKAQRAYARKHYPGHHIAGDLVQTIVTEAGVEQRVIHSWPDEVAATEAAEPAEAAPC